MITYLQESENLLLILSVHVTLLKQQEIWNKSIAWSDMPETQRGQLVSARVSEQSTLPLGCLPRFTTS